MSPMTRLATLIALTRLLVGTPGRHGGMVRPLLDAVQVHGDWTIATLAPKPLMVRIRPSKVGVPWMKYIIQGLCILHSLIQILRVGHQELGFNLWFQPMEKFVHGFCLIDVSDADNHLLKPLNVFFHRSSLPEKHQSISGLPLLINNSILLINGLTEVIKILWCVSHSTDSLEPPGSMSSETSYCHCKCHTCIIPSILDPKGIKMPLHLLDPELGVFQVASELRWFRQLRGVSHAGLHDSCRRGMALCLHC